MGAGNGVRSSNNVRLGSLYIKQHSPESPPYQVDMSIYERPFLDLMLFGNPKEMASKMKGVRDVPGFTRLDYAFDYAADLHNDRDYSWKSQGSGFMLGVGNVWGMGQWEPAKEGYSEEETANIIKKAALFYGASIAGIAMVDERWFYSKAVPRMMPQIPNPADGPVEMPDMSKMMKKEAPKDIIFSDDTDNPAILEDGTRIIPRSMNRVIVMALEMDADAYSCETSALSMAASLNGYSRMWFTASTMAEFIRALGYKAIPMGNDTALSQPMAIDAGMGELSRAGLLITPKYGPRVRLCKVITDMPLIPDNPISFGVAEFCNICGKCAEHCPSKSIPRINVPLSYEAPKSGNGGVLKWAVDGAKCQHFWMVNGAECHTCIRVCPFTKPKGLLHDFTRSLIGTVRSETLDRFLLFMDDVAGYGRKQGRDPREFWKMDHYIHINR